MTAFVIVFGLLLLALAMFGMVVLGYSLRDAEIEDEQKLVLMAATRAERELHELTTKAFTDMAEVIEQRNRR